MCLKCFRKRNPKFFGEGCPTPLRRDYARMKDRPGDTDSEQECKDYTAAYGTEPEELSDESDEDEGSQPDEGEEGEVAEPVTESKDGRVTIKREDGTERALPPSKRRRLSLDGSSIEVTTCSKQLECQLLETERYLTKSQEEWGGRLPRAIKDRMQARIADCAHGIRAKMLQVHEDWARDDRNESSSRAQVDDLSATMNTFLLQICAIGRLPGPSAVDTAIDLTYELMILPLEVSNGRRASETANEASHESDIDTNNERDNDNANHEVSNMREIYLADLLMRRMINKKHATCRIKDDDWEDSLETRLTSVVEDGHVTGIEDLFELSIARLTDLVRINQAPRVYRGWG